MSEYAIVNYVVDLATQPSVTMTWQGATSGACTPTYWGPFQTGVLTTVTGNFTLKNTGASNGQVTVTFTEDGSTIHTQGFFIGAGKTQAFTAQWQVGDCSPHQYWGYPSNVQRA